jgi:hypothetical protein
VRLFDRLFQRHTTSTPTDQAQPRVLLVERSAPSASARQGKVRVPPEVRASVRQLALEIAEETKRTYGYVRVPGFGETIRLLLVYNRSLPKPQDRVGRARLRALHHVFWLRERARHYRAPPPKQEEARRGDSP